MNHPQVEIQPIRSPEKLRAIAAPSCPQPIAMHSSVLPIQPASPPLHHAASQPSPTAERDLLELLRQFDEQVQQIDQLAVERAMATLQLIAILQQIEATGNSTAPSQAQTVGQTAQFGTGRLLSLVCSLLEAIATLIIQIGTVIKLQFKASRSKTLHPTVEKVEACRKETIDFPTLQAALSLTLTAALLRIGLDWLVQIYPGLWFMTTLLMVLPAVAAVTQSTRSPRSGLLWGIRLTLILIGLLLGGRV